MLQRKDVRVHHFLSLCIETFFCLGIQTDLEGAEVESHRDGGQLRHELEGADGDALDGEVDGVARRAGDGYFLSVVVPSYIQILGGTIEVPGNVLKGLVAGKGDVVEAEAEVRAAPRQPLPHQRDVLEAAVTNNGSRRSLKNHF